MPAVAPLVPIRPDTTASAVATPSLSAAQSEAVENWQSAPQSVRERAVERAEAVRRVDELAVSGTRDEAVVAVAALLGVSVSTLRSWITRTRKGARHGVDAVSALADRGGRGRPAYEWGGDGADALWRLFCTDYLRLEKPDEAACYRRIEAIATARGWECPPPQAFSRRLAREVPRGELVRARQGAIASLSTQPYLHRSVAELAPLEIINGDGRRHDVIVEFESGRIGRPVVWAWQDVYSRKILAWGVAETESADLVRTTLHQCITDFGVPARVVVDQTRAASNKWLTGGMAHRKRWRSSREELPGLLKILSIEYRPTSVDSDAAGRGQGRGGSKPIERAFGDLARQVDTHPALAGAFTGRSPVDRPETHRQRAVAVDAFRKILAHEIGNHNARTGRRTEAAAGDSFDNAFFDALRKATVRRITESQAAVLLLAAEDVLVRGDASFILKAGRGSGLPANRYYLPALLARAGKRVVARFNPDDLHAAAQVFDGDGRYLGAAMCLHPVGFADSSAAKEYERLRRRGRRAAEQGLAARTDRARLLNELKNLPAARNVPASRAEPAAVQLVAGREVPSVKVAANDARGESARKPISPRTPARSRMSAALGKIYNQN